MNPTHVSTRRIAGTAAALVAWLFVAGHGGGEAETRSVTSADGRIRIEVPGRWSELEDLHDDADLQVADLARESFLIVLSEPKANLEGVSLEEHSKLTRSLLLYGVDDARVTAGPTALTIGGRRAIQVEIAAVVDHDRIFYLHTTVEGEDGFHQILAWTMPSRYETNREAMESVIASFAEI